MESQAITNVFWHRALAEEYEKGIDLSDALAFGIGDSIRAVRASYSVLISETLEQFKRIREYDITVQFTDKDPYEVPEELFADIGYRRILRVFTGGELPKNHPMAASVIASWAIRDAGTINNVFRAVHDFFGHYGGSDSATNYPFGTSAAGLGGNGLIGEEYAYQRHKRMYSADAWLALTVETRCQTAANNLLPRVIETGGFIEQKAIWLPEWCYKV